MSDEKETTLTPSPDAAPYTMNWVSLPAIIYYLYIAGLFTGGLTTLVGLIMAYVMSGEFNGELMKGHRRYLIRTFWFTLLWCIIGLFTFFIVVGYFIILAACIWMLYREIKGLYLLSKGQSPY